MPLCSQARWLAIQSTPGEVTRCSCQALKEREKVEAFQDRERMLTSIYTDNKKHLTINMSPGLEARKTW